MSPCHTSKGKKTGEIMPGKKKQPKYEYLYVLQGNYGYGWEDLIATEQNSQGLREIKGYAKDYRENERGVPFRVIQRRVPRNKGR